MKYSIEEMLIMDLLKIFSGPNTNRVVIRVSEKLRQGLEKNDRPIVIKNESKVIN